MKTKYLITTLLLMALSLSSCREITVKTKVNSDGSFTRILTLKGDINDSTSVVSKSGLPYPVDDSWELTTMRDTADSTRLICIYSKNFPGDEELKSEIASDTSWMKKLDREITVKKKFMFFYSFITYREIYRKADPSGLLDYKDYMSPRDLEWLVGNKQPLNAADSTMHDSAEARAERYIMDSYRAEVLSALRNGIQRLNDPELQSFDLEAYKNDSLFVADFDDLKVHKYFIDSLVSLTGQPELHKLNDLSPPVFADLVNKIDLFEKIMMMHDYGSEVEMPGLITGTNSIEVIGNTVAWQVQPTSFYFEDYEMFVESRVVNQWAFVLSGAVLLLLIIVFVVRVFR
ncbi:MAG TPA: hypothetical protein VK994_04830 [Bacteroidales bacterium]|nr:hypothetical protein [Bacteroidales bacterium]